MDWGAAYAGLRAWFVAVSGIPATSVVWEGDAVGMRALPWASLRIFGQATEPHLDEVRYTDQGDDEDLLIEVVGNRRLTLSVRVQSRDQRPDERAFVVLERVRDRLLLPSSQEALSDLGFGLRESAALVDLGSARDRRQESVAALDIVLHYTVAETGDDEVMGTIEHVGVGGTVSSGGTEITVADEVLPPLV